MKNFFKPFLCLFIFLVVANTCYAQDSIFLRPKYALVAKQVTFTANVFEFDIFIKHTNRDSTIFQYAGGQYFFKITQGFKNGGTLTYRYSLDQNNDTITDLALNMIPRNPSMAGDSTVLRLAINTFPGAGNGPIIPDTGNGGYGVRVIRMKLTNTAAFGGPPGNNGNFKWQDTIPNPYTKIFAYTDLNNTSNQEISKRTSHTIEVLTDIDPGPVANTIPREFSLSQNYPNPFNPSTKIEYAIPVDGKVDLKIYDITGREIMNLVNNEVKSAGTYAVRFDGSNLASGIYFYRIKVDGIAEDKKYQSTKRMVLIK